MPPLDPRQNRCVVCRFYGFHGPVYIACAATYSLLAQLATDEEIAAAQYAAGEIEVAHNEDPENAAAVISARYQQLAHHIQHYTPEHAVSDPAAGHTSYAQHAAVGPPPQEAANLPQEETWNETLYTGPLQWEEVLVNRPSDEEVDSSEELAGFSQGVSSRRVGSSQRVSSTYQEPDLTAYYDPTLDPQSQTAPIIPGLTFKRKPDNGNRRKKKNH
ncbi:uncharacterized protein C8A04DRAFT_29137 [Dichotomopilus funicola]|uniref:Uncharacterized protein n=1 Tax=Dichotomopilus funicola TaxID=1934379 RepID=A0AAN6ZN18_9PEZI|nr:hypothetical protein C8A04DRAFT_29137 [Dichotomopilus funicola]